MSPLQYEAAAPNQLVHLSREKPRLQHLCTTPPSSHHVHCPQHAFESYEDDPPTRALVGTSTYPAGRAGHGYEMTISSDDAPSRGMDRKLREVQARDKFGSPAYRTYCGRQIPVYKPPAGLGMIDKVRGQQAWTVWVDLAPRLVTDMLVLLGQSRQLFLSIYEHNLGGRGG